ncbi:MAG: hypothetical protein JW881_12170 [Spirochaetales bacterium]|nr:hypothetical protein [Spirochaetales bacterium]
MLNRMTQLFILFIIVTFLNIDCNLSDSQTNGESNNSYSGKIIREQNDNPSMEYIRSMAKVADEKNKPVIIYSINPGIEDIYVTCENNSIDSAINESTGTAVEQTTKPFYIHKMTVIEPGKVPEINKFYSDDGDNSDYQRMLHAMMTSLEANNYKAESRDFDGTAEKRYFWYLPDEKMRIKISEWDENKNGWVAEIEYVQEINCSPVDPDNENKRWWTTEWDVHSMIDRGDYKEDTFAHVTLGMGHVGPWISCRYIKAEMGDERLKYYGPTTGSKDHFSYGQSVSIGASGSGPNIGFGFSKSWDLENVTITAGNTSFFTNVVEWIETYREPDLSFLGWRLPDLKSHDASISHRGALWTTDSNDVFDYTLTYATVIGCSRGPIVHYAFGSIPFKYLPPTPTSGDPPVTVTAAPEPESTTPPPEATNPPPAVTTAPPAKKWVEFVPSCTVNVIPPATASYSPISHSAYVAACNQSGELVFIMTGGSRYRVEFGCYLFGHGGGNFNYPGGSVQVISTTQNGLSREWQSGNCKLYGGGDGELTVNLTSLHFYRLQ